MTRPAWCLVVLGGLGATTSLAAQDPGSLRDSAIAAYRELRYDTAAARLRRVLAAPGPVSVLDRSRAMTYVYLGATELLRGRDAAGRAAFREALRLDPRIRADTLVFPPEITGAFERIRRGAVYVSLRAPADTTVVPGASEYRVWVYVSTPSRVTVDLVGEGMTRRLYRAALDDSAAFAWNGLDSAGGRPPDGRFGLRVATGDEPVGRVALPLRITSRPVDTLTWPANPDLLPAAGDSRRLQAFVAGMLSGAAVVVVPTLLSGSGRWTIHKMLLAGALGTAGFLAFSARNSHRLTPAEVARERESARDAWQRRRDAAVRENARRRSLAPLEIRVTGPPGEAAP